MLQCGPRQPNLRVTVFPVCASKVSKTRGSCRARANQRTTKIKTEDLLMKRLFLIAGLMAAFMLLVVAASAQKAGFAGTWSLDKSKSQGLSTRIQGADKVTWTVAQDDKTVSIDQKVEGGQPSGGGGGGTGGGGGMGGGGGRGPGGPAGPPS